jgi:hypothetical protein
LVDDGVPPLPHFTDVLTKLGAGWAADRMDDLLPHAWIAAMEKMLPRVVGALDRESGTRPIPWCAGAVAGR